MRAKRMLFPILGLLIPGLTMLGFTQDAAVRSGMIVGELKAQHKTADGKNSMIDVLAPGEEKARRYHVLYGAKTKGPIASVLTAVRAAHVGDRVELEWVATGHGPAIKSFKVLKKGTRDEKAADK